MFVQIANAIALEAMFNVWCGKDYQEIHQVEVTRAGFIARLPKLFNQAIMFI